MPDQDLSSVTRVIVAYNSSRVIGECLDAVQGVQTIVVDNASTDNSVEISRGHGDTTVIETGANLGFGGGVNRGLDNVTTDWALVINPDAVMDGVEIGKLLDCAAQFPEAGMIAPIIVDIDGVQDYSHDKALHRRRGMTRKRLDPFADGPICVEYLSGAAFLVRMDAARQVKGFDETFFLFFEDDDFCWRIAAAGYSLILEPAANCMHLGGASTTPSPRIAFRRDYHMGRSLVLYRTKHLGRGPGILQSLAEIPKLLAKALGRSLTFNWSKAGRDWGRLSGMINRIIVGS